MLVDSPAREHRELQMHSLGEDEFCFSCVFHQNIVNQVHLSSRTTYLQRTKGECTTADSTSKSLLCFQHSQNTQIHEANDYRHRSGESPQRSRPSAALRPFEVCLSRPNVNEFTSFLAFFLLAINHFRAILLF